MCEKEVILWKVTSQLEEGFKQKQISMHSKENTVGSVDFNTEFDKLNHFYHSKVNNGRD